MPQMRHGRILPKSLVPGRLNRPGSDNIQRNRTSAPQGQAAPQTL